VLASTDRLADYTGVRTLTARLVVLGSVAGLLAACAGPRVPLRPAPVALGTEERGLASWYGHPYHGRRTSSGEIYDMNAMTAAHRSLPFGTWVHVENLDSGQTARVRVNDRGPFVEGRILDVSRAAGVALGAVARGVIPVRVRVVAPPEDVVMEPAFTVQVGAFTEESAAADVQQTLAESGFESDVVRAEERGRVVYRVRTGRFSTRPEADAYAERLAARGFRVIVVSQTREMPTTRRR
jgi:rare lipoprotein A